MAQITGTRRTFVALVLLAMLATSAFALLMSSVGAQTATRIELNFDTGANTASTVGDGTLLPTNLRVGDTLTVDVAIVGAVSIDGASFDLSFDPLVLDFTNATFSNTTAAMFFLEGGLDPTGNQTVSAVSNLGTAAPNHDPDAGLIRSILITSSGADQTGNGLLGRFKFDVVGVPSTGTDTTIALSNGSVGGGNPVSANPPTIDSDAATFRVATAASPPTAVDDAILTPAINVPVVVSVLANDTFAGTTPVLAIVDQPNLGAVQITGTGVSQGVIYTPPGTIFGDAVSAAFTYTVTDSTGLTSAKATVSLELDGVGPVFTALPAPITFVQNRFAVPGDLSDPANNDPNNSLNGIDSSAVSLDGRTLAQFLAEATATDAHGPVVIRPATLTTVGLNGTTITFEADDAAMNPNTTIATPSVAITVLPFNGDTDGDGTSNADEDRLGTDPTSDCNDGSNDAVPEDVNADGFIGLDDVLIVVGAFGQPNARLDLDGDGFVDLDDVLAVVAMFGTNTSCP